VYVTCAELIDDFSRAAYILSAQNLDIKEATHPSMKSASKVPRGWPDNIVYLAQPLYSKTLSKEVLQALHHRPESEKILPKTSGPSQSVRISPIKDQNHPANGQFGLFAAHNLAPSSFIICYHGNVHSEIDTDPTSDYDLCLSRELEVGIDAAKMGNEARFCNDYRGIESTGPNAEFLEIWMDMGKGISEKRMAIFVLPAGKSGKRGKGILKGAEILLSYGKGFWKERAGNGEEDQGTG
jgi:SET domain-containing protein